MKISLVIPTRSRAIYLRECLKTVAIAVQACDHDVEVIVSDNASDDETEEVCAQSNITGLKYFRQPDRLSMRQNFEAGLHASTGSHVVFIGDDDAVAPNGLVLLYEMIESGDHDIFKWRIVNYVWPDPDRGQQGGVVLRNNKLLGRVRRIDPKALLADFKAARFGGYQSGAMVYHGCISRRLINKVRAAQNGTYFWTSCPDVYVSVANLVHADSDILAVDLPVTIGGSSPRSNGTAGVEYIQNSARSSTSEHAKFVSELAGDPCLGQTTAMCPSINLVTIDALQLSHKFGGVPLDLAETAWLARITPEIKNFYGDVATDMRAQASILLPSLKDKIEEIPARLNAPVPRQAPTKETAASANTSIGLTKIKVNCSSDMNGLTDASKVIDQICGASVPFAELPTTVFGSLLRLRKMIGRARAYKNQLP